MTSALITVGGLTLPTTLPQGEFDPLIRTGTLAVHDAKNARSWPTQAAPDAASTSWLNLVRGGVAAVVPATWTWNAAGGFVRPGVAATSINLGTPDLTNRDVVVLAWVKVPSVPTALTPLIGRLQGYTTGADNQFAVSMDGTGKPRLDFMSSAAAAFGTAATAITVGVHQFGMVIRRSGSSLMGELYVDGALVATGSLTATSLNVSTYGIALGDRRVGNGGGTATAGYTYYRALIEDLTASGRTGAQVVAADWAANNGRFS